MPIIVPVIIIGANVVGIATGSVAGVRGGLKVRKGRQLVADALAQHSERQAQSETLRSVMKGRLSDYQEQRDHAKEAVLDRAVRYLRSQGRMAEVRDIEAIADLPMHQEHLPDPPRLRESAATAGKTLLSAAQAARGSPAALARLAVQVGKASTGAAVKDLSGAAAKNASLAWLGGGAKAVGGGGVALGSAMGPLTAVGTAVTVVGIGANVIGEQTLTRATATAVESEIAAERLEAYDLWLGGLEARLTELSGTLTRLVRTAEVALDDLESADPACKAFDDLLSRALIAVSSVGEILRSAVFAEDCPSNSEDDEHERG